MKNYVLGFLALAIFLGSCGSEEKKFIKFPPDDLAKEMSDVKNFSIILYDMNVTEDDKFMHQYKIITRTKDPEAISEDELAAEAVTDSATAATSEETVAATGSPEDLGMEEKLTEWKEVSEEDFEFHSSDMGMEIYSKVDGKLNKVAAPPGYSQYVGNEQYGQWKTDNSGNSFWAFYGRYMFISSMFHLMMPTPYGYYRGYGAYRGRTPYYGPNGKAYGTNSAHANGMNSKYTSRANSNSKLKNKVNNSINKSSSRATGGKRTAATRQSRSSSRYSGSSKSRSSSFGGK